MENKDNCPIPYCKEKFSGIESRLNAKSEELDGHDRDIVAIKTDMTHLTRSMNALTKALWGFCGTVIAALFAFFIWYVQSI